MNYNSRALRKALRKKFRHKKYSPRKALDPVKERYRKEKLKRDKLKKGEVKPSEVLTQRGSDVERRSVKSVGNLANRNLAVDRRSSVLNAVEKIMKRIESRTDPSRRLRSHAL